MEKKSEFSSIKLISPLLRTKQVKHFLFVLSLSRSTLSISPKLHWQAMQEPSGNKKPQASGSVWLSRLRHSIFFIHKGSFQVLTSSIKCLAPHRCLHPNWRGTVCQRGRYTASLRGYSDPQNQTFSWSFFFPKEPVRSWPHRLEEKCKCTNCAVDYKDSALWSPGAVKMANHPAWS